MSLWCNVLERLANRTIPNVRRDRRMQALKYYPAVILLYGGGMASLSAQQYGTLLALLTRPTVRTRESTYPFPYGLYRHIWHDTFKYVPGLEHKKIPMSNRLYDVLREPLREFIPDDETYERTFDRFEYVQALVSADVPKHERSTLGAFMYRHDAFPDGSVVTQLKDEANSAGADWQLLKLGFFGGSVQRLQAAMKLVDSAIEKMGWP